MSDSFLAQSASLRRDFFEKQNSLLTKLVASGQSPRALFVGCSDSRVVPEKLFDAQPGDFFMLRNIANIIPPYIQTEIGIVSVLEFAILHLQVPHIIICGHTDCGGIYGLDERLNLGKEPALVRWLDLARPAQRDVDFRMSNLDPKTRHLAIVEQNVINQMRNVASYPFVRAAQGADELTIHGWVYHLAERQISYYDPDINQFVFEQLT